MNRILITGASGFLGSRLVKHFQDTLDTSDLNKTNIVCPIDLTHDVMRCDIRDYRKLEEVFINFHPDFCYHLAAEFGRINGSVYYEQLWSTNVIGTQNIIDLCIKHKCKLIFASSSEVYGDFGYPKELREDMLYKHTPCHKNIYALSKYTNEKQIEIGELHGLEAVILRFFNVYGPGEKYSLYRSVIAQFCHSVLNDLPITAYKDYWRSYLYIDDWVVPVVNVMERWEGLKHDVYNIASAEYVSIEKLVENIGATNVTWKDVDELNVRHKQADVTLATKDLGLAPKVSLQEGISNTMQWMREK